MSVPLTAHSVSLLSTSILHTFFPSRTHVQLSLSKMIHMQFHVQERMLHTRDLLRLKWPSCSLVRMHSFPVASALLHERPCSLTVQHCSRAPAAVAQALSLQPCVTPSSGGAAAATALLHALQKEPIEKQPGFLPLFFPFLGFPIGFYVIPYRS